jgi:hypothetical protein
MGQRSGPQLHSIYLDVLESSAGKGKSILLPIARVAIIFSLINNSVLWFKFVLYFSSFALMYT